MWEVCKRVRARRSVGGSDLPTAGIFAAAAGKSLPYPSLPQQPIFHTALGNELADFMQGKESAKQALADITAAYNSAAKEKGLLN